MANLFQTPELISKLLAIHVENSLVLGKLANKDFKDTFLNQKTGGSIEYDKPTKFLVQDGADITSTFQDITDSTGTINVNQRKHVAFKIPSQDLTLSAERLTEKYFKPMSIQLANKIDDVGAALYDGIYNVAGTAGTTPATFSAVAAAGKVLTKFAVPDRGRVAIVDPEAEYDIPNGLSSILQPNIVDGIIKEAHVGRVAKFDIFGDQNIKQHTAGDWAGTVLVAGASQTGTSLNLDGFTNSGAAQLKKGDVFSLALVNSVNPVSRADNAVVQTFTLTADATVTAGAATVLISPAITVTGVGQTVSVGPLDNAVVGKVPSHRANIAMHRDAMQLVTVPLVVPEDAMGGFSVKDGIGIRWIKWYDGKTDDQFYRMDVLFGWVLQYPEFAVRLMG